LSLSKQSTPIDSQGGKILRLPSPRERALKEINDRFGQSPGAKAKIDDAIAAWSAFEEKRRSLDDPQDIERILRGAGVLNFRITVNPGEMPTEQESRANLRNQGPRAKVDDARWFRMNKIEGWIRSEDDFNAVQAAPAAFFSRMGYVVEPFKGDFYMLAWDKPGLRLTEQDGGWSLASAFQGQDQLGRPAIDFRMDVLGAEKLGQLTEANVGRQMAVLLDDEVYTAPRLQSRIASQGQISGSFTATEIEYVIRVLSAGSLQNKLTGPISKSVTGPQLGADNLAKGLNAGIIAFVVVAIFMVFYYFLNGVVAVIGLIVNGIMLVGAMGLNQAAFTLPGIAGVILTFGMAVDANVLIYERMREEYNRGADLRTAVRLGYSKALAAIVDGNVTTLIVCVVLLFTGTQEIKGFGLTLGIGTVTTFFAQLFVTRLIYSALVDHVKFRKMNMLTTKFPGLQRLLTPNVDWLKIRGASIALSLCMIGVGVFFILREGSNLLGTEFRGGTSVTLTLKPTGGTLPSGEPQRVTLKRPDVEDRVHDIAKGLPEGHPLRDLRTAEVLAVNPEADSITSSTFTVRSLVDDASAMQRELIEAFAAELDTKRSIRFTGFDAAAARGAPVYPISTQVIGDAIDRPQLRTPAGEFYGGVAIVLGGIEPPIAISELQQRLDQARTRSDFSDTLSRRTKVIALDGTDQAATAAAVLVADPNVTYFEDERGWTLGVREREWKLVQESLTQDQTLASVQSFTPAVADSFIAQAIVATLLSTILIIIYVWVRFNSFRYSFAAIITTLHDCLVAIGFVAMATVLYHNLPGVASVLKLQPFKIDLNVMAAILTILGYSLNDTVVTMDRIRENRGKLPHATRQMINDAINQTVSRTIITAGSTFLACIVLYIFGGEGVRVFAYTMLVGIVIGTYSSIAIAAPLVWSRRTDSAEGSKSRASGASSSQASGASALPA
jgi:SecD/SecF fusion protein